MSPSAVSLPATPLLLPGAGGRADPLGALRRDVVAELRGVAAGRRVVILARGARTRVGPLRPDVPQIGLGEHPVVAAGEAARPCAGVGASVALALLDMAIPGAPSLVVEVSDDETGHVLTDVLSAGDVLVVADDDGRGAVRSLASQVLIGAGRVRAQADLSGSSLVLQTWEAS